MPGTKNSGGHNRRSRDFHLVHGTFREDRGHADADFIDPPKGVPDVPKHLAGAAKAEWARMVDRLETAKTLSKIDDAALYQYVQLFAETEAIREDHAQLRKLTKELRSAILKSQLAGSELIEAIGKIVVLQQLSQKQSIQLRQGHMGMRQWLVEFGMTPAARNRVKVPKTGALPVTNPLEKYTNRNRG